ncbi:MAG TPA: cytidylate kinase-like family protein [Candidatus Tumulicola sp.]
MIVAVNRELGAGGLSVGEALAAEFGATLLDERALIAELAQRGGFSAEYLARVDERPPSLASAFMEDLAKATLLVAAMELRTNERAVLDEVRDVVLHHARAGDVVLIGHGGAKLMETSVPRRDLFSILLHARRAWRVERVMYRFRLGRKAAEDRVRRIDELRRRYIRHFFEQELFDAQAYDLVVDTERVGMDAAIDLAKTAVRAARS